MHAEDPFDTLHDLALFHATRLEWVYTTDSPWIAACKSHGYLFGGTLSPILPDTPNSRSRQIGRIHNLEGKFVTAPWMRMWEGVYWGCVNSPAFCRTLIEHAKLMLDGGADVLQVDDPDFNVHAVKWGGCYCPFCRQMAASLGLDLHQDMETVQKVSVEEFYGLLRHEVDRQAGRHITFSCNNYQGKWNFPYNLFDYGIAEVDEVSPGFLLAAKRKADAKGKAQSFVYRSTDVAQYRKAIALCYACGLQMLVPYDVYIGAKQDGSDRFFGLPEKFADLYGLVRSCPQFFDGYEDAAVAGGNLVEQRYGNNQPVRLDDTGEAICAFVRAKPQDPRAPVVIHLIDWGGIGQPFTLALSNKCFFQWNSLVVKLLLPPSYDEKMHATAERSKDYAKLAIEMPVEVMADGGVTRIRIPGLSPWGMLVVMPEPLQ
jgi:hypothetical protein